MISVIIPNTEEPTVIRLTFDNLSRELQAVDGSEIIIADSWQAGFKKAKGDFITIVEPDCLVSSSYFSSNLNLFKKNSHYRKLAMVASCLGIDSWGNRIYNYKLEKVERGDEKLSTSYWRVAPERKKKATGLYPIQVGFVPGAIFRKSAFGDVIKNVDLNIPDLAQLSAAVSFYLWDSNRRIVVNPNTTYVTTDRRLENPGMFDPHVPDKVAGIFEQEQI